ncbi:hypothetical protein [Variovorax fucosicus]|uniref:hypothetical protein n=1 Tax=Variovorax fucosicus TaxID=3053517 RepID=UPI0025772150|nr:hypothetical protein [Variovorax sp. J22G47]MDM0058289.1 hypothetical protein [Variovorax sp. J22G47]
MRDFPGIDKEAESAALRTVFFTDGEFEGRPYRASRANYLAFLSLRGVEINAEIGKLRALFAEHPVSLLEQDVICLLTARNWRFHNIACVVLAAGFIADRSLAALWACIHSGSWTSPQLVATAAYVDSRYQQKARELLADHSTYFKSIVPLAEILAAEHGLTEVEGDTAFANLQEARAIDRDNSGAIGISWLANLRGAFGSSFVRHT